MESEDPSILSFIKPSLLNRHEEANFASLLRNPLLDDQGGGGGGHIDLEAAATFGLSVDTGS